MDRPERIRRERRPNLVAGEVVAARETRIILKWSI